MRASLFGTLAGGGANPGIQPDAVAGLFGWWKADSLVLTNNDPVSTWADSSVNGNDLNQTLTARPLYITSQINSLPIVRFDGVNDFMTTPPITKAGSPSTILFVIKNNNASVAYLIDTDGGNARGIVCNNIAGTWQRYDAPTFTVIGLTSTSAFQIISTQAQLLGAGLPFAWGIGSVPTGILPCGCDLAELIIYDVVISAPDYAGVQQYLATKYAL